MGATAPLRWLGPRIGLDDSLYLLLALRREVRDGALLNRALTGAVIRVPGRFQVLPGALVRPMFLSDPR